MNESAINAAICPLCGRPNLCPMVADPQAKGCWCGDKKFPRELLAQVPKKADRKVCICQQCLADYLESNVE